MVKIKLADHTGTIDRYIVYDPDRHGNDRWYFRRKGQPKVRLPDLVVGDDGRFLATETFLEAYRAALHGKPVKKDKPAPERREKAAPGSLRALADSYISGSRAFRDMDPDTQARRKKVINDICTEPIEAGKDEREIGTLPFAGIRPRVIRILRDRAPTPSTANAKIRALRGIFAFAVEDEAMDANPATEVKYIADASGGYHSWTPAEVRQFEACHPIGTVQRLALGMLLFTGVRRSDVVLIGKQHRSDGGWKFTQFKGRRKSPVTISIPILPQLQVLIDAKPSRGLTYLETKFGKPFTANGFGTRFRTWADKAGLPHCSAHGLRKAGAVIAAENGATPHQLMAIFGWKTLKEAQRYTEAANRQKLAMEAMHLLGYQAPVESVKKAAG